MKKIVFYITPIGKPRMVRFDTWSRRPAVAKYWLFKDQLNILARQKRYVLGDTLDIIFLLPMPDSWSRKKRLQMIGKKHDQKPDFDNLVKAFTDSLTNDDSKIYDVHVRKYWDRTGSIEVFL